MLLLRLLILLLKVIGERLLVVRAQEVVVVHLLDLLHSLRFEKVRRKSVGVRDSFGRVIVSIRSKVAVPLQSLAEILKSLSINVHIRRVEGQRRNV